MMFRKTITGAMTDRPRFCDTWFKKPKRVTVDSWRVQKCGFDKCGWHHSGFVHHTLYDTTAWIDSTTQSQIFLKRTERLCLDISEWLQLCKWFMPKWKLRTTHPVNILTHQQQAVGSESLHINRINQWKHKACNTPTPEQEPVHCYI